MIEDDALSDYVARRYAGWDDSEYKQVLQGEVSLAELAQRVEQHGLDPQPVSGQQEYLENLVNRYL